MAALAASRGVLYRQNKEKYAGNETLAKKISIVTSTTSMADLKLKDDLKPVVTRTGLSDGTNVSNVQPIGGFINKIRRDSVSGKPKEAKKVALVRTHSKINFKPSGRRSSVSEKKFTVTIPQQTAPHDHDLSPMADHSPMVMIRNKMTRKPHGVEDIDAGRDPLKSSIYAQDIIDYLQAVERRFTFPSYYLMGKKDGVTPNMRTVLMDWLVQVQVHQELSQSTLHLCAAITDRFLAKQTIKLNALQLTGITALLIAAKYHERFPPEITDLCHLTDNTYTPEEVLKMERFILKKLQFDLNFPGPIIFVDRFLQIKPCERSQQIMNMSMFILDLMLTEVDYVHFYPSMLAASAIYVSRDMLGCETLWDEAFVHYTKYSERDLKDCVKTLRKVISKVHKSKYTGTKTKYAHDAFDNISHHRSVIMAKELWPDHHDEVFDRSCDEMNISACLDDYETDHLKETRV